VTPPTRAQRPPWVTPSAAFAYCHRKPYHKSTVRAIGKRLLLSVNRTKTALRVFFRFLTDAGYLSENPPRLIRSTPTDRKVPGYLSIDEARKLLNTIAKSDSTLATRDHAMFSLLLGTSIRLSSLVGLNVGDVNLAEQTITIKAKGGREETVFLSARFCKLLARYIKAVSATDRTPLFRSRNSGKLGPRQVQLRLKLWLGVAGITTPLSVHSLRPTFAARLYSKTGDLLLVRRALGHKHIVW
jgi:integrase/recombinase XerC